MSLLSRSLGDYSAATSSWPGNVRELENVLERAVAVTGTEGELDVDELRLEGGLMGAASSEAASSPPWLIVSDEVRALAERALADGRMPRPDGNAYRARAQQRAAFVYLRLSEPGAPWPDSLLRQFESLFKPGWSKSENGRGLKDVALALGAGQGATHVHLWLSEAGVKAAAS